MEQSGARGIPENDLSGCAPRIPRTRTSSNMKPPTVSVNLNLVQCSPSATDRPWNPASYQSFCLIPRTSFAYVRLHRGLSTIGQSSPSQFRGARNAICPHNTAPQFCSPVYILCGRTLNFYLRGFNTMVQVSLVIWRKSLGRVEEMERRPRRVTRVTFHKTRRDCDSTRCASCHQWPPRKPPRSHKEAPLSKSTSNLPLLISYNFSHNRTWTHSNSLRGRWKDMTLKWILKGFKERKYSVSWATLRLPCFRNPYRWLGTLDSILEKNDDRELDGHQVPLKLLAYTFNSILFPSFIPEMLPDLLQIITMIEFHRLRITQRAADLLELDTYLKMQPNSQTSGLAKSEQAYFRHLVHTQDDIRQIFLNNVLSCCVLVRSLASLLGLFAISHSIYRIWKDSGWTGRTQTSGAVGTNTSQSFKIAMNLREHHIASIIKSNQMK